MIHHKNCLAYIFDQNKQIHYWLILQVFCTEWLLSSPVVPLLATSHPNDKVLLELSLGYCLTH